MIFGICFLLLIALVNKIFLKKGLVYPGTVFALSFSLLFMIIEIVKLQIKLNEVSIDTIAIICLYIFAFNVPGYVLTFKYGRRTIISNYDFSSLAIKVMIVLLIVYLPVLYLEFNQYNPGATFAIKILRIREYSITEKVYTTLSNNMIILSSIIFLTATYSFATKKINKYWMAFAIIGFIIYNFLTGTRATIIILGMSAIFIYIRANNKISMRMLLTSSFLIFIIGAVVAVFLGKDGADRDKGILYNSTYVMSNYLSYTIQGVHLFDNYVINRYEIEPNWDILSGTKSVINKIGGDFSIEEKHAQFSSYGEGRDGNVYTIFFSVYPIYGLLVGCLFFALYGLIAVFLSSISSPISTVLLGYVNGALVISIFNEQVWTNMIFTIKLIVVLLIFALVGKYEKYRKVRLHNRLVQS